MIYDPIDISPHQTTGREPPRGVTEQQLRPSGAFEASEARAYGGVPARALARHARDAAAFSRGQKPHGAAQRTLQVRGKTARALEIYITVKRALRLWARPLMEGFRPRTPSPRQAGRPRRSFVWRTKPPTAADWAAKDAAYGFDVRATSPSHIQRRVYRLRAKRRVALCGELDPAAAKPAKMPPPREAYGPPAPRDYKDPKDLFTVWPPVFLRPADAGLPPIKPAATAPKTSVHAPKAAREEMPDRFSDQSLDPSLDLSLDPSWTAQLDWARAMYGEAGARNFLLSLGPAELASLKPP